MGDYLGMRETFVLTGVLFRMRGPSALLSKLLLPAIWREHVFDVLPHALFSTLSSFHVAG